MTVDAAKLRSTTTRKPNAIMSVEFAFIDPNAFIGPTFGNNGLSAVSESDERLAQTLGARKR